MDNMPTGFFFPRSRAEAIQRLTVRTANERARLRRIIQREKQGTIGSHYAAEVKARLQPSP